MHAHSSELDAWSTLASRVDETEFRYGRIGPYRLGRAIRRTAFGEVLIAIEDERVGIVELDLCTRLARSRLTAPDGPLMANLAEVVGLGHPFIAQIIGSGFDEGVPYIVRHHRLGVTVERLLERARTLPPSLAVAIQYGVASALDFLSQQGSAPGACSMGGFNARDIFVGFDGAVRLVGLGLQAARSPDLDPIDADLTGCFALARRLDEFSDVRLSSALASARNLADIARAARKRDPEACAHSAREVAAVLREHFSDQIREDRAYFGLSPLH